MKKVLSLMTLFLASLMLLLGASQGVYAFDPGIDDYEDLFTTPWTQSYSYGRIRNYDDPTTDVFLRNYGAEERAYLANNPSPSSESSTKSLFANTFNTNNEDVAAQSPYSEFTIELASNQSVLKHVEDVAAVFLDKPDSGTVNVFTIYYWDSEGVIATDTYSWDTASGTNHLYAYFHGGFRSALTGQEHFATNVDDPKEISFFVDYFKAWDDIDGDISESIIIETDNYTANKNTIGTYSVTLSVTDSSDNESTMTFYITVADIIAPTVSGSNPASISYTEVFDTTALNAWLSTLTKSDNYDESGDVTLNVSGHSTYLTNSTIPGTYVLSVTAEDESGNESDPVLFDLVVVDDVDPEFDEPIQEISTSIHTTFTPSQIMASLIATDEVDGDISDSITLVSDTYSPNKFIPGTWTMVFRATDDSGNSTDHTVTFIVTDEAAGWFVVTYPTPPPSIVLTPGFEPTLEQIITLLENTGQLPEGFTPEDVSINNYLPGIPGTYTLSIGGHAFLVKVLADDEPLLPPLHPVAPTTTDYSWMVWTVVSVLIIGSAVAWIYFNKKNAKK